MEEEFGSGSEDEVVVSDSGEVDTVVGDAAESPALDEGAETSTEAEREAVVAESFAAQGEVTSSISENLSAMFEGISGDIAELLEQLIGSLQELLAMVESGDLMGGGAAAVVAAAAGAETVRPEALMQELTEEELNSIQAEGTRDATIQALKERGVTTVIGFFPQDEESNYVKFLSISGIYDKELTQPTKENLSAIYSVYIEDPANIATAALPEEDRNAVMVLMEYLKTSADDGAVTIVSVMERLEIELEVDSPVRQFIENVATNTELSQEIRNGLDG
jgi:hypothetical protein